MKKVRNPAVSAKQYRLAEAVLHGTARTPTRMSKKVAKEIVDQTPAAQRSAFMQQHRTKNVTDRALRYRANATPPPGARQCCLCGGKKTVEVGHVNGHEEDSDPRNLFWTCRSCNVKSANTMRKAGIGRLTRQFNPQGGAQTLGAWMNAISSIKGEGGTMAIPEAVALIHATPAADRSRFAREIWDKRRTRGTDKHVPVGGKMRNSKPKRKKNLFGFGKKDAESSRKKVTFSSRLSKEAHNLGYLDKNFETWLAKQKNLASSFIGNLRSSYEQGRYERTAKEAARVKAKEKAATEKAKAQVARVAKAKSETYKGKAIIKKDGQFEVLGQSWNTLKQAKEYVDVYMAAGGRLKNRKNPTATLQQGKASAYVVEMGSNRHTAEIIRADGGREEHTFSGPKSFKAAMSWARLRLHEVANPAKWKLYPISKKPRRKNPEDTAVRMYEKFHGLQSTEVREYVEEHHRHSWLAALGPLVEIVVRNIQGKKDVTLYFPDSADAKAGDVVMLTVEESGTQLFCTGGDQDMPVKVLKEKFGMVDADFNRDNVLIGTIIELTYRTKKSFEKNGKEEIDFFHQIGMEGSKGVYPVLIYHPRNPSLEIAGGRYYIGKAEEALGGVSPGIIG